tara:strand:+ start:38 stop:1102 length:1065 start_codon:yes stop_codon:yes gene_type:complete
MINIIFTGLISVESRFRKSVKSLEVLKKQRIIDQIILSTWIGELDKYEDLRKYLIKNDIKIIESTPPTNCKGSILFQMKALHKGLDHVNDKELMVLKTRPDLYLSNNYLLGIIKIDLNINDDNVSVFEKKVWVPWFEVTKPFYLADECIYSTFNDMRKLVNYDMIYDSYYRIDSGVSHIRRFIDPFIENYPILQKYLKYLSTTAHGTVNRFEVLDEFMENEDYWKFIYLYYYIVKNYFYIGVNNTESIEFRKWSESTIALPKELKEVFKKEYSWDDKLGHIYSENNEWLEEIYEIIIKNVKEIKYRNFTFKVNEAKLADLHKFALAQGNKSAEISVKNKIKQSIKRFFKLIFKA